MWYGSITVTGMNSGPQSPPVQQNSGLWTLLRVLAAESVREALSVH